MTPTLRKARNKVTSTVQIDTPDSLVLTTNRNEEG